jgi:hypothetical protein
MRPVKRTLWLTSGPDSISYFQIFLIIQTLKIELVSFLTLKNHQTLQGDSMKYKEQLSLLAQLQIPSGC